VAKTIKFLPLTFIAGSWGFVIFIPYLLTLAAFVGLRAYLRR
jgi:hypothetical protein